MTQGLALGSSPEVRLASQQGMASQRVLIGYSKYSNTWVLDLTVNFWVGVLLLILL